MPIQQPVNVGTAGFTSVCINGPVTVQYAAFPIPPPVPLPPLPPLGPLNHAGDTLAVDPIPTGNLVVIDAVFNGVPVNWDPPMQNGGTVCWCGKDGGGMPVIIIVYRDDSV